MGCWMGAAALLVHVLIPFIAAFDMSALSAGTAEHAHHATAVAHLRGQHSVDIVPAEKNAPAVHHAAPDGHAHAACPLCLALHAAAATPAASADARLAPAPRPTVEQPAEETARLSGNPASYLSRAPPRLA